MVPGIDQARVKSRRMSPSAEQTTTSRIKPGTASIGTRRVRPRGMADSKIGQTNPSPWAAGSHTSGSRESKFPKRTQERISACPSSRHPLSSFCQTNPSFRPGRNNQNLPNEPDTAAAILKILFLPNKPEPTPAAPVSVPGSPAQSRPPDPSASCSPRSGHAGNTASHPPPSSRH